MTFSLSFESLRNQFRVQESFMVLIIQFSKDIILILELKPTDLNHVLDTLIRIKWLVLFAYSKALEIIHSSRIHARGECDETNSGLPHCFHRNTTGWNQLQIPLKLTLITQPCLTRKNTTEKDSAAGSLLHNKVLNLITTLQIREFK